MPRHDPPEWMRETVILRDPTCVFPGCCVSSRRCDLDHIEEWRPPPDESPPDESPPDESPPDDPTHPGIVRFTRPANLAPLCRRHHRLKTFTGWTYHRAEDGTYTWCDRCGRPLPGDD